MNSTYIIAEVGPNHNGSIEKAQDMVENLASIGVDAVKFQLNFPENCYSRDSFKPSYQIANDKESSPLEMSKKYQLTFDEHIRLSEACSKYGVDYLCTAFEMESLQFLTNNIGMPYYKIPSGEILTVDMLEHIAGQKKPILLSTGMASYDEIEESVQVINKDRNKDITILHCISNYPTPAEDVNLNVMLEIKSRFNVPIGFSDHTLGNDAAIAAVALGATVIEKHVTYDKNAEGPDHKASATISEFASLVKSIRNVEKMMGTREKFFSEDELEIKRAARKSIVTTQNLPKDHVIREEDLCFKRPGFGFKPTVRDTIIGRKVFKEIEADRVIFEEHLQ